MIFIMGIISRWVGFHNQINEDNLVSIVQTTDCSILTMLSIAGRSLCFSAPRYLCAVVNLIDGVMDGIFECFFNVTILKALQKSCLKNVYNKGLTAELIYLTMTNV